MAAISDVPRSRLRDIDSRSDSDDVLAERIAAAVYGATHDADSAEWYDAVDESSGTKYEVKSAHKDIGDDYPAAGRFRLRKGQIRSLINSRHAGDSGSSWVVFVLFEHDQPVDINRMHASTVLDLVKERGGWNRAGHDEFDCQHKLDIGAVFDEEGS